MSRIMRSFAAAAVVLLGTSLADGSQIVIYDDDDKTGAITLTLDGDEIAPDQNVALEFAQWTNIVLPDVHPPEAIFASANFLEAGVLAPNGVSDTLFVTLTPRMDANNMPDGGFLSIRFNSDLDGTPLLPIPGAQNTFNEAAGGNEVGNALFFRYLRNGQGVPRDDFPDQAEFGLEVISDVTATPEPSTIVGAAFGLLTLAAARSLRACKSA